MSLGKSVSLSMSSAKLIANLLGWCDEAINELNEEGPKLKKKHVPQIDLEPFLTCHESMIEEELAFQLGKFPFPDDKFVQMLKKTLRDIKVDSPNLADSVEGKHTNSLVKCPRVENRYMDASIDSVSNNSR